MMKLTEFIVAGVSSMDRALHEATIVANNWRDENDNPDIEPISLVFKGVNVDLQPWLRNKNEIAWKFEIWGTNAS